MRQLLKLLVHGEKPTKSSQMSFIGIEKEMYDKAEQMEGGWKTFKDFMIADKVVESDVITSFYLKPVDGQKLPSYKPGQYITFASQFLAKNIH